MGYDTYWVQRGFSVTVLLLFMLTLISCTAKNAAQFKNGMGYATCTFCDLRYDDFSRRDLENADFSGAYLFGTNFSWSIARNSRFESAIMYQGRMEWADFDGSDFSKASVGGTALFRSSFRQAQLRLTDLSHANLTGIDLTRAHMVTAILEGVDLTDAQMSGVNLRSATLRDANLSNARLRDADLQGAVLTRANLQGTDLKGANFTAAVMNDASFANSYVHTTNFRKTNLNNADFSNAILDAVNFQGARLRHANFKGATIKNVILQGADLCGAIMPDGQQIPPCPEKATSSLTTSAAVSQMTSIPPAETGPATADPVVLLPRTDAPSDMTPVPPSGDRPPIDATLAPEGNATLDPSAQPTPPVIDAAAVHLTVQDNRRMVAVPGNLFAKTEKGIPAGVIAETLDVILKKMGFSPIYVSMPIAEMPEAVENGFVDVLAMALPTGKSAEKLLFTEPLIEEFNTVLVRRNEPFALERIADLHERKLGGREGYIYPLLKKDPEIKLQLFSSDGEMIRNLILGKLDAVIISGISNLYVLRSEGIMAQLDVLKKAVGMVPMQAALSPGKFSRKELELFNKSLKEFKQGTEWNAVLEHNGLSDLVRPWEVASP
ncbi:MAG: pentapeptide repeat-containing protein [Magnetococcales bacterium]|nr:pentapeptide repeat-containing protein [Magnetococcales bacterium]MBF0148961.1 pentapeptide repeat-containing protein [Magnetococcales bacterium]MBF0173819.1 pentapeptide repeat-containing protein [Magnetococcales bacterium]MBF0347844.1 pentapeptide repeat-containing protein [Magnetococcales bacterium]MBF0631168.1 pentapeptide repeat-containing protein [Magnetococcales bacterium]